jgi:hypothetical protein
MNAPLDDVEKYLRSWTMLKNTGHNLLATIASNRWGLTFPYAANGTRTYAVSKAPTRLGTRLPSAPADITTLDLNDQRAPVS